MIIIANLKGFTLSHDIIIMDEECKVINTLQTSMKNIAENIVEQCFTYQGSKVKLIGNKKYANKLSQDIKQLSLAKYSLNIDIEIV